nr:hypothetical protein [Pseudopedobacter sp.]
MTTLTIQIPDAETELVKKVLEKFNVKIVSTDQKTPNKLTVKTIEDAKNGIGIDEPIKNIRSFLTSL